MRKATAIVLSCVVAAALCVGPQVVPAQGSAEQKEKEKNENKATDDKEKKKSNPVAEVNRIYGRFKKRTEPAKKEPGSLRKSINDAWDKLK
jgi:hypothetical protein